jgi:four helix bundle protein
MEEKIQIRSYKDLIVWQKAHLLVQQVFKTIKPLKKNYISYEIIKQLVRSVTSIPANIVEGYYSHKGKTFASHLEISKGSTGETDYWSFELQSNDYITQKQYDEISINCVELIKILSGLIKKIREKND